MTEEDIYGDLDNFDVGKTIDELEETNRVLNKKVEELQQSLQEMTKEISEVKKLNDKLKLNISVLLKTAKAELERKDRQISDLRQEVDSLVFRKGKFKKHNGPDSEEFLEKFNSVKLELEKKTRIITSLNKELELERKENILKRNATHIAENENEISSKRRKPSDSPCREKTEKHENEESRNHLTPRSREYDDKKYRSRSPDYRRHGPYRPNDLRSRLATRNKKSRYSRSRSRERSRYDSRDKFYPRNRNEKFRYHKNRYENRRYSDKCSESPDRDRRYENNRNVHNVRNNENDQREPNFRTNENYEHSNRNFRDDSPKFSENSRSPSVELINFEEQNKNTDKVNEEIKNKIAEPFMDQDMKITERKQETCQLNSDVNPEIILDISLQSCNSYEKKLRRISVDSVDIISHKEPQSYLLKYNNDSENNFKSVEEAGETLENKEKTGKNTETILISENETESKINLPIDEESNILNSIRTDLLAKLQEYDKLSPLPKKDANCSKNKSIEQEIDELTNKLHNENVKSSSKEGKKAESKDKNKTEKQQKQESKRKRSSSKVDDEKSDISSAKNIDKNVKLHDDQLTKNIDSLKMFETDSLEPGEIVEDIEYMNKFVEASELNNKVIYPEIEKKFESNEHNKIVEKQQKRETKRKRSLSNNEKSESFNPQIIDKKIKSQQSDDTNTLTKNVEICSTKCKFGDTDSIESGELIEDVETDKIQQIKSPEIDKKSEKEDKNIEKGIKKVPKRRRIVKIESSEQFDKDYKIKDNKSESKDKIENKVEEQPNKKSEHKRMVSREIVEKSEILSLQSDKKSLSEVNKKPEETKKENTEINSTSEECKTKTTSNRMSTEKSEKSSENKDKHIETKCTKAEVDKNLENLQKMKESDGKKNTSKKNKETSRIADSQNSENNEKEMIGVFNKSEDSKKAANKEVSDNSKEPKNKIKPFRIPKIRRNATENDKNPSNELAETKTEDKKIENAEKITSSEKQNETKQKLMRRSPRKLDSTKSVEPEEISSTNIINSVENNSDKLVEVVEQTAEALNVPQKSENPVENIAKENLEKVNESVKNSDSKNNSASNLQTDSNNQTNLNNSSESKSNITKKPVRRRRCVISIK